MTSSAARIITAKKIDDGPFGTGDYVAVTDGVLFAAHTSWPRGGCLDAGTVVLQNLDTGAQHIVDLTSRASSTDEHVAYLLSLAAKHVGAGS